jgi:hypothetical protein
MTPIEFWPDYGPGPLWLDGRAIEPESLGILEALAIRLRRWNDGYEESKIPIDGNGDTAWLTEGAELLRATREALAPGVDVVATEPWWGEEDPAS